VRTAAGYLFKCKTCGTPHLLVSGKVRDGIRVPCYIHEDKVEEYKQEDFSYWHGFLDIFTSCMVEAKD